MKYATDVTNKNLLILHKTTFLHGWGGSTQRILALANGLCNVGWNISLLKRSCDESVNYAKVYGFPGDIVNVPTLDYFSFIPKVRGRERIKKYLLNLLIALGKLSHPEGLKYHWAKTIASWWDDTAKGMKPSIIWAVYTPGIPDSLVAAQLLSDRLRVPWIAELHDPFNAYKNDRHNYSYHKNIFDEMIKKCTMIVTTTRHYKEKLVCEHGVAPDRIRCVYLSYDDKEVTEVEQQVGNAAFVLLHAGHLHGADGRNAIPIVVALSLCAEKVPGIRDNLKLRLLGAGPGGDEAMRVASQLGIQEMVENLPQVSFEESLAEMKKANVLVVIKYTDQFYDACIPGKMIQYFGAGKPVLGIMPTRTEAAEILKKSNTGVAIDNFDIKGIATAITQFWENKDNIGVLYAPNREYVSSFSDCTMSMNVDAILREAIRDYKG